MIIHCIVTDVYRQVNKFFHADQAAAWASPKKKNILLYKYMSMNYKIYSIFTISGNAQIETIIY